VFLTEYRLARPCGATLLTVPGPRVSPSLQASRGANGGIGGEAPRLRHPDHRRARRVRDRRRDPDPAPPLRRTRKRPHLARRPELWSPTKEAPRMRRPPEDGKTAHEKRRPPTRDGPKSARFRLKVPG